MRYTIRLMMGPDALLCDAEWLAHRYVEAADSIRFVRVRRDRHAAVPFLTDDCLLLDGEARDLPINVCLNHLQPGRAHFIFHSAFSGSTLLTRAFDRRGLAMGLSEPVILNDVVGLRRRGARPAAVARLADCATRLLARPFGAGEAVLIKPSNVVNPLAELLLALNPNAKAVFLYSPLETFLISVARKGLACRLWVRELARGYLTDAFLEQLGFSSVDLLGQTDLQVAAVGWLAQHRHFFRLRERLGEERLGLLDSDALTRFPAEAVVAVAQHFGLSLWFEDARSIAGGQAFSRHSKSGVAYSRSKRDAEYAAALAAHGDEIGQIILWSRKVADAAEINLDPPGRLLNAGDSRSVLSTA